MIIKKYNLWERLSQNTFGKSITKPRVKFIAESYSRVHADFFHNFQSGGCRGLAPYEIRFVAIDALTM